MKNLLIVLLIAPIICLAQTQSVSTGTGSQVIVNRGTNGYDFWHDATNAAMIQDVSGGGGNVFTGSNNVFTGSNFFVGGIFSSVDGSISINTELRQLQTSTGGTVFWASCLLSDLSGVTSLLWDQRQLIGKDNAVLADWSGTSGIVLFNIGISTPTLISTGTSEFIGGIYSSADGVSSINSEARNLINSAGINLLDWESSFLNSETGPRMFWKFGLCYDADGGTSLDWLSRQISGTSAAVVMNWSNDIVNFPIGVSVSGTNLTSLFVPTARLTGSGTLNVTGSVGVSGNHTGTSSGLNTGDQTATSIGAIATLNGSGTGTTILTGTQSGLTVNTGTIAFVQGAGTTTLSVTGTGTGAGVVFQGGFSGSNTGGTATISMLAMASPALNITFPANSSPGIRVSGSGNANLIELNKSGSNVFVVSGSNLTTAIGFGGTPFAGSYSGSTTMNIVSLATLTSSEQLITVSGVTTTNCPSIQVGYSGTLPVGLIESSRRVVSTGTVGVSFFNTTALSVTSTSTVIRATVFQY